MLVGYARVSTTDQNLHLQTDTLQSASCGQVGTDTVSGAHAERPGGQENGLLAASQSTCCHEAPNRLPDTQHGTRRMAWQHWTVRQPFAPSIPCPETRDSEETVASGRLRRAIR